MISSPFITGGALTSDNSNSYIERQADKDILLCLNTMKYVLVIEPRQQGKTSLIYSLIRRPSLAYIRIIYIDMTTLDRTTTEDWYYALCDRILAQLNAILPNDNWPERPSSSYEWRNFLLAIALKISNESMRLLIALDEVGSANFEGSTEFFSVLRDIYNSREFEPQFNSLTFLLVGAFHPRNLISDDRVSPFNIAQRVRLTDFSLAELRKLVGKGPWSDVQASSISERIYYWTNGQPYLAQLLCSYLDQDASPADVDQAVDRLRREDENHLPPILSRLQRDSILTTYLSSITSGDQIKFYPGENPRHAQLELLGVITSSREGYCEIRNRIYELAIGNLHEQESDAASRTNTPKVIKEEVPKAFMKEEKQSPRSPSCIKFKLQLSEFKKSEYFVRVVESPFGESNQRCKLPFSSDDLFEILKILSANEDMPENYRQMHTSLCGRSGIQSSFSDSSSEFTSCVGRLLFDSIMLEEIRTSFQMSMNLARSQNSKILFELRFDENIAELARYPWELMHDGRRFLLPSGMVELVRYISYPEATTALKTSLPLRMLYIRSRPMDLSALPAFNEELAIRHALEPLVNSGSIIIDELETATYDSLLDYLDDHKCNILHFDGHGVFAKLCRNCGEFNFPHMLACNHCKSEFRQTIPRGYLAFESDRGNTNWLSSSTLGHIFGPELRLGVLSACSSGTILGEVFFGSTGPALIQAGVPAVVATQLPISVEAATGFAKGFYRSLSRFRSLPTAVNAGRRRLFDTNEWFIPTLYMRSRDYDGYLFGQ